MIDHESGTRDPLRLSSDDGGGAADPFDFPKLFGAHFDELARYAYRYVQSIDEAKDVVHDAFLRLWQQRDKVDFQTSVRAYLFATVRNLAVDRVRRHAVRERWRVQGRRRVGPEAAAAADPERDLAQRDLVAAIGEAVEALPPRQREVLLLRWHRQASYEEIAQILGISPKTVGIHVTRALATLRDTLRYLLDASRDSG